MESVKNKGVGKKEKEREESDLSKHNNLTHTKYALVEI